MGKAKDASRAELQEVIDSFDFGGKLDLLLRCDLRAEPVHIKPELPEPVVAVRVVARVTAQMCFVVADDVLRLD